MAVSAFAIAAFLLLFYGVLVWFRRQSDIRIGVEVLHTVTATQTSSSLHLPLNRLSFAGFLMLVDL